MSASTIPTSPYAYLRLQYASSSVHPRPAAAHRARPKEVDNRRRSVHAKREYYKLVQCELSPEYPSAMDYWSSIGDAMQHEQNIRAEIERALHAQKRARAKKAAQSTFSLAYGPQTQYLGYCTSEEYQPFIRGRHMYQHDTNASAVTSPGRHLPIDTGFKFPSDDTSLGDEGIADLPCTPPSLSKKLAPLSRFNPFLRTRAESLSSIVDDNDSGPSDDDIPDEQPMQSWRRKLRRAATVADLFLRINREAKKVPSTGSMHLGLLA